MIKKLLSIIKFNDKQVPEKEGYVLIHRYSNGGFKCKPMKSDVYKYGESFIDIVITDLELKNGEINNEKIKSTIYMEQKWSGCFCFFDIDTTHLLDDVLSMRALDKMNFAYFPNNRRAPRVVIGYQYKC